MIAPRQPSSTPRRWDPLTDLEQPLMERPANTHRHGLLDQIEETPDTSDATKVTTVN
jgi:hypothetical protein